MVDISVVVRLLKFITEQLHRLYGYDEAECHAGVFATDYLTITGQSINEQSHS